MWAKATNDNQMCGVVLLDLRKAFDLVSHQVLLEKLQQYKCTNFTLNWFESYLHNRNQSTVFRGTISKTEHVKVGVPQGSVLGPLMFIVFMNDLPLASPNSQLDMYADDTTMTYAGSSIEDIQQKP